MSGPHAYAGDFREGAAVIRRSDGLCVHVNSNGAALHAHISLAGRGLLELDMYHKGLARARDERGWFWGDRAGDDAGFGVFAAVEPFYNGQALVTGLDGVRRVVTDAGSVAVADLPASSRDVEAKVQSLSTAYWASAALRMGLDAGLPAAAAAGHLRAAGALLELDATAGGMREALARRVSMAWVELGLLQTRADDESALGPLSSR